MNKVVVFFLLTIFSFSSFALDSPSAYITSIRTTDWGVILTVSDKKNGCNGGNIKFSNSIPNIERVLSVALAAQMANKKIKARYVECSNKPWTNTASAKDLTVYTN